MQECDNVFAVLLIVVGVVVHHQPVFGSSTPDPCFPSHVVLAVSAGSQLFLSRGYQPPCAVGAWWAGKVSSLHWPRTTILFLISSIHVLIQIVCFTILIIVLLFKV